MTIPIGQAATLRSASGTKGGHAMPGHPAGVLTVAGRWAATVWFTPVTSPGEPAGRPERPEPPDFDFFSVYPYGLIY